MRFFLCAFIFCVGIVSSPLNAQESIDQKWDDFKKKVVDTAKSTFDGAGNFIKGMGQSFGYVSPDYKYSLQVWNDAPAPILAAIQRITPVMGADFSGNIVNSLAIGPFANSGTAFNSQQLYISVWLVADAGMNTIQKYAKSAQEGLKWGAVAGAVAGMGVASPITTALGTALGGLVGGIIATEKLNKYKILRRDIYPWQSNDTNVYYYRTYTERGTVKGEYLGIKGTTSDFLGTFFNNTDTDVQLKFVKDGQTYTVTLEKQSYNLLQSTFTNSTSMRSNPPDIRAFTFLKDGTSFAYIPLAPQGIGNVIYNDKTKQYDAAGPMMYTYEVYKDQDNSLAVSLQGLTIGNFAQPISTNIRDINPAECHIWLQSAQQSQTAAAKDSNQQSDPLVVPFDLPETPWISYKTKDFTIQQKLTSGAVLDVMLIRPQLAEKEAWLYCVSLPTADEKKVKKFLDRLSAGIIGPKTIFTQVSNDDQINVQLQPDTNGIIDDTQGADNSGLKGYLLLADRFAPAGVGSGPFYYYIPAAQLRIDQLLANLYLDDSNYTKNQAGDIVLQDQVQQDLIAKITQWITQYPNNAQKVRSDVLSYLQQKGNKQLFSDSAQRTLTDQGKHMLDAFLTGPISIAQYPVLRQAGTNYYVFGLGQKPSEWPT